MKTDLIEILYSEKVILAGKRTEQDVAFSVERAARINSLMERKIFNEEHHMANPQLRQFFSVFSR